MFLTFNSVTLLHCCTSLERPRVGWQLYCSSLYEWRQFRPIENQLDVYSCVRCKKPLFLTLNSFEVSHICWWLLLGPEGLTRVNPNLFSSLLTRKKISSFHLHLLRGPEKFHSYSTVWESLGLIGIIWKTFQHFLRHVIVARRLSIVLCVSSTAGLKSNLWGMFRFWKHSPASPGLV